MFWLWIIASMFTANAAEDKNLKHPENCDMFYSVDICPPGEHFDANIGVCTLAQLANCKIANTQTTTVPRTLSGDPAPAFAHPTSCEKYYRINICDDAFNFDPATNACDYPKSKGCPSGCPKLEPPPGMNIKPIRCIAGENKIGDDCRFDCPRPLQAMGTTLLTCTESGWESGGAYITPTCVEPVALAEALLLDMVEELEDTDGGLLFVMDESGSVTARNFEKEKIFIQGVIGRLPLSANRSAGVILFSDKPRQEVNLGTKDTCIFYKQVLDMKYKGGGTDIRLALEAAKTELDNTHHHKKAVVLLTDGQSPNATEVANELKDTGVKIFTIGVTGHDEKALTAMASLNNEGNKTLFYAINDSRAFDSIAAYLESEYVANVTNACTRKAANGLIPRY